MWSRIPLDRGNFIQVYDTQPMGFKQGIDPLHRGAQKSDLRAEAVVKVLLIRMRRIAAGIAILLTPGASAPAIVRKEHGSIEARSRLV